MKQPSSSHPIFGSVLLVEDDPIVGGLIEVVLAKFCAVTWVQSGKEVFSLLESKKPDLILMDIGLPDMSGLDICKNIKSNSQLTHIPVIFITGDAQPKTEAEGLKLGAVDFITKPIRPEMLSMRVKTHIELKRHRDDLHASLAETSQALHFAHGSVITSMAILAECRDAETGKHVQRTKAYVRILTENLKLSGYSALQADEVETISESAVLHDIGKIGIQDYILAKPGRLTTDEYDQMKSHTILGRQVIERTERLFGSNPFLRCARDIAEFHHEKWDGTGYPHGICGTDIPLCARIMAIADVYDALTMARPYKQRYSHKQAVQLMTQGSHGHFDPSLLHIFEALQGNFLQVSQSFESGIGLKAVNL